ncbi:hypothetical protein B0T26DRAFT_669596 [Lasiosphaeria miniovina]|uniref:Uncharacterized protein n=1 Tax=Lasiosphaeria miniovina TaxID=1954250 RepID=A0AA40BFV8_9PEZI|nr:uncharacterized protein B0T26DRAFT_669596 [Lasiosphaeria miniovina]KAK0733163.1 hypothetical protein B0T26DRAFT_669596 [Lasiosphaeria miniovina]
MATFPSSSAAKLSAVQSQVPAASKKSLKDVYPKIIAFELDNVLWPGNLDQGSATKTPQEKQPSGYLLETVRILIDVVDAQSKVIIISRGSYDAKLTAQLQDLKYGFERFARRRAIIPDFPILDGMIFLEDKISMAKSIDTVLAALDKADEPVHVTDILMFGNSPSNIEVEVERDIAFQLSDHEIMNDKDVRMLGGLSMNRYNHGLEYWRRMRLFHQRVGPIPKEPIPQARFYVIGYAAMTNPVVEYGNARGIQRPHNELTVSDTVPGIVEIGIRTDQIDLWIEEVQKLWIHEIPVPNSATASSHISSRLFQDLGLGGHYVPEFGVPAPLGPDGIPRKASVRPADQLKALRDARVNYDFKVQRAQKGAISSPHVTFNSLSTESHTIFAKTQQTSQMIIPHHLHRMLFAGKQVCNGNFNVPQAGVNPSNVTPYHELKIKWHIKQVSGSGQD